MTVRLTSVLVAAASALIPIGCGSGSKAQTMTQKELELKEIHEMYMAYIKAHQKSPAQASDFSKKEMENLYPAALIAIQQNKYVIVFGVSASDASAVIAYEKDGGSAVTADGNIKTISADEAKALKK